MVVKGSPDLSVMITSALVFGTIAGLIWILMMLTGNDISIYGLLAFSIIILGIQWYIGPFIVRWASRAREVSVQEAPELHAMVERVARESGIPKPKLYIVDNPIPNAFAFGRGKSDAGVALHTGLLQRLNKQEVEAVVAHEIGHIKHNDVVIMTIASIIPVLLYYAAVMVLSGRDERPNPLAVFAGGIIAQLIGQLLVMWLSRQREYYADAHSVKITRNPMLISSALVKITYNIPVNSTNNSLNTLYVAEHGVVSQNMINAINKGDSKALLDAVEKEPNNPLEIFATHPSLKKRLKALLT